MIKNLFEMYEITSDKPRMIQYLQENCVLRSEFTCKCARPMKLIKRNSTIDGYVFKCAKQCESVSIRKNSILENSNIPLEKFIMLTYLWLLDIPFNKIEKMVDVSGVTLAKWNKLFNSKVKDKLDTMDPETKKLGGEGATVEIDETLITKKQKYRWGTITTEAWAFGGKERGSNRWFAEIVPDRNRQTLINKIVENIKQGTIIISDEWRWY